MLYNTANGEHVKIEESRLVDKSFEEQKDEPKNFVLDWPNLRSAYNSKFFRRDVQIGNAQQPICSRIELERSGVRFTWNCNRDR